MTPSTLRKLILLGASCLYLVLEFAFNAHLLDTVAGIGGGRSVDFEPTEYFGRTMAGVGFVLLLLSVFSYDGWQLSRRRDLIGGVVLCGICSLPFAFADAERAVYVILPVIAVAAMLFSTVLDAGWLRGSTVAAAIAVAAFTGMFHGQKIFFQKVTVEGSSAEQRQAARYLNLLRTGLDTGAIALEGMPNLSEYQGTPEHKTFLTLLGGVAWLEPNVASFVREHKDGLVNAVEQHLAAKRMPDIWQRYTESRERFQAQVWQPYANAVERIRDEISGARAKANDRWQDLQNDVDRAFESDYQPKVSAYREDMRGHAERAAPRLRDWYEAFFDCDNERCFREVQADFSNSRLNNRAERILGQKTELIGDWCRPRDATAGEKVKETVDTIESLLNNPIGTLISGGLDREYFACVRSQEAVANRLVALGADNFKDRTGGLPPGLNQTAFELHPVIADRFRERLQDRGVDLPSDWTPRDRRTFVRAMEKKIENAAYAAFRERMENRIGARIPAGLSFNAFVQNAAVQDALSDRGYDTATTDFTITSRDQLRERVLQPRIESRIEREIDALEAGTADFADGGSMADAGKTAARLAFIPPLALGASLTLGLITLVKNLAALLTIPFLGASARWRIPVQTSVWITGLAAIAVLPFQVSNAFSNSDSFDAAVSTFADSSPAAATAVEFVQRIQPVAYPLGAKALATTRVDRLFENMADRADAATKVPADLDRRMEAMANAASRAEMKRHQTRLKTEGFYTGAIDGIWGPKTRSATREAVHQGYNTRLMQKHDVHRIPER